jgi:hypothetical protein
MARVMVVAYLIGAFRLWMIHDALRRPVHTGWRVALLFPVPLSDLVYFFAIKMRDFGLHPIDPEAAENARLKLTGELAKLEREVEQSPSFHNRVLLGWALYERESHALAETQFERARSTHPRDKEALLGLGLCQLARGASDAAVETLTPLVEHTLAYEDYEAALALAEALFRAGYSDKTAALLERVIGDSGELAHHLVLARYQLRAQDRPRAQRTLRSALDEFEAKPDVERHRDGALATEARRLLRTLEEQAS